MLSTWLTGTSILITIEWTIVVSILTYLFETGHVV